VLCDKPIFILLSWFPISELVVSQAGFRYSSSSLHGRLWAFTINRAFFHATASVVHSSPACIFVFRAFHWASFGTYGRWFNVHAPIWHGTTLRVNITRANYIILSALYWTICSAFSIHWYAKIGHRTFSVVSTGTLHFIFSARYGASSTAHWVAPHASIWHLTSIRTYSTWALHLVLTALYWTMCRAFSIHWYAEIGH